MPSKTHACTIQSLQYINQPIDKSGYLYVYVSNETPNIDVFFDNLQFHWGMTLVHIIGKENRFVMLIKTCLLLLSFSLMGCTQRLVSFVRSKDYTYDKNTGWRFEKQGIRIFKNELLYEIFDLKSKTSILRLDEPSYLEFFGDEYLIISLDTIFSIGSSNPVYTFPRYIVYILDLRNYSSTYLDVFKCDLLGKIVVQNDRLLRKVNQGFTFDYQIRSIDVNYRRIVLKGRNGLASYNLIPFKDN